METIIGAIISIISGLIGAFIGGMYATKVSKGQIEVLKIQIGGEIHERLYNQNQTILGCLANFPNLRPYFYDNKIIENDISELEKNRIMLFAEMFLGFHELIIIHLSQLPLNVIHEWENFIIDSYNRSPIIRKCFSEFKNEYSKLLVDFILKQKKIE